MRTLWTPKKELEFLESLEDSCNVREACKVAQLSRSTAYERRGENAEFAQQWDKAIQIGAESLEDEAVRRARDGVDEPVFYQGVQCGTVRKYSDTLLIFLLKGAKPEKYRERTDSKMELTADPEIKRVICVNL